MKLLITSLFIIFFFFGYAYSSETFVIGRAEGDGELVYPSNLAEGPDGNIYVYDRYDAYIKVYSDTGQYLRRMGGRGQGPGEIQRVEGVAFSFTRDGKKLFFTEFFAGHRWITFMDLQGRFLSVLKINKTEQFGLSAPLFQLDDGSFLMRLSTIGKAVLKDNYYLQGSPIAIARIDAEGNVSKKIKAVENFSRISYRSAGADLGIPFVPVFQWTLLDQDRIVFSNGLSSSLQIIDLNGREIGVIPIPLPEPVKVTQRDLETWRKNMIGRIRDKQWYNRFGNVIEKYKKSIYEIIPNLSGLQTTPVGNLLIAGPRNETQGFIPYWLVDRKGRQICHLKLAAGDVTICPNVIIYIQRSEEGDIEVTVLKRSGSEDEDLRKLPQQ